MDNTQANLDRFSSLQDTLDKSLTGRSGDQAPTIGDINTQKQLLTTQGAIRASKDAALRENWYGQSTEDKGSGSVSSSSGVLNRTLNAFMMPLYGMVGATDYITGASRGNSIGDAINKNMNVDKRTFGDVIRPTVGKKAGAIGGLTLDIVLDPLNWVTMGTAALVPRVFAGTIKGAKTGVSGAVKGASAAAESRLLESMLTARALTLGGTKLVTKSAALLNPARYLSKSDSLVPPVKLKAAEDTSKFMKLMEDRSISASRRYDELMGNTAVNRILKPDPTVFSNFSNGLKHLAQGAMDNSPQVKQYFNKYFNYSNAEWTRLAQIKDALIKTAGADMETGVKAFVKSYETGENFDTALAQAYKAIQPQIDDAIKNTPIVPDSVLDDWADNAGKTHESLSKALSSMASEVDSEQLTLFAKILEDTEEAAQIAKKPQIYVTSDHIENGLRMSAEKQLIDLGNMSGVVEDLKKIIARGDMTESGIEWWDKTRKGMNDFQFAVTQANKSGVKLPLKDRMGAKVGKFFDVYEGLISVFKRGAVGGSPTAWTNAIVGNLVMAKMVGIDVLDTKWLRSVKKADSIIGSKSGSELFLNELFDVEQMLPFLKNHPTLFEATTGLSRHELDQVTKARHLVNKFKTTGVEAGIISPNTADSEVITMMEKFIRDANEGLSSTDEVMRIAAEAHAAQIGKLNARTPAQRLRESLDETGQVKGPVSATDFITNEFFDSAGLNKFLQKLSKSAEDPTNYASRIANVLLNKLPDAYGGIDYRYKLGSVLYATTDGVKEAELRIISRMIKMSPEDVIKVTYQGGVQRFHLSAAKAFEVANEGFLNYNAMPPIVKLLRHLPFVGAPFASFMYGMYAKTLKTALYNPSMYNKANYMIQEVSGEKTPIERGLLEMDRYEYLNDPAMMKLNFPGNQMVFLNLGNMLPYYSLNMFQPSGRKYEGMLPNAMIQTIDKMPLMKDPIGSTLFDYLVMPMFLGEEMPKGSFGQPLYPKDATALEKGGYLTRSLADPFIPGFAQGPLGLTTGFVAPGITQYMPGYRWRQLAEAVQGNTSIGASSKESAPQRTGRSLAGWAGIPIQNPVPYTYLDETEVLDNNQ